MRLIRRRLIALALAVTASQLVGLAAAPAALCQMGEAASSAGPVVCTCEHDPGGECPLHKQHQQSSSSSESSPKDCRCSGTGGADVMLTTLMAPAGPIVERHRVAEPDIISECVLPLVQQFLSVAPPPVSPPPRA
jgi:hypothetical protein